MRVSTEWVKTWHTVNILQQTKFLIICKLIVGTSHSSSCWTVLTGQILRNFLFFRVCWTILNKWTQNFTLKLKSRHGVSILTAEGWRENGGRWHGYTSDLGKGLQHWAAGRSMPHFPRAVRSFWNIYPSIPAILWGSRRPPGATWWPQLLHWEEQAARKGGRGSRPRRLRRLLLL